jgi:hypothetical protein
MADNTQSQEKIDQWQCVQCRSTIPANQPPVSNAENCSCVEVGTDADGAGEGPSQPPLIEQPTYSFKSPESFTSSVISVKCNHPDGSESDLVFENHKTRLNQSHHRQTSFQENMSFQMRRFLSEGAYPETSSPIGNTSESVFRNTYIQSQQSPEKKRPRSPSIVSRRSMQSCGSAHSMMSMRYSEVAACGWGTDATAGVGTWYDDGDVTDLEHCFSSRLAGFPLDEFDNGSVNVIAGPTSRTAFSNSKRDLAVEESPVRPSISSPEENGYPLPPEWMTRSMSDDGHQSSLVEPVLTTRNKPRFSLVALSKAAISLRRWMRKKRSPARDKSFVLTTVCSGPVLDITTEEHVSILSDPLDQDHIRYVNLGLIPCAILKYNIHA